MAYSFDQESGELRRADGSVVFVVDERLNPEMLGHLATPMWLAAINAGDGGIDEQAETVTITSLGKTWKRKTDADRAEIKELVQDVTLADVDGFDYSKATLPILARLVVLLIRRAKQAKTEREALAAALVTARQERVAIATALANLKKRVDDAGIP